MDDNIDFDFSEAKATDPIISFGSVELCRCDMCLQETFRKCCVEHPEWLTPKSKKVATKHLKNVTTYIVKNTPLMLCLVTEYWDGDKCFDFVKTGVCQKHLQQILEQMNDKN